MDAGLEKVVAAETVMSDVQGAEGRLIIRGVDVEELARAFSYEQTAAHLWSGYFDGMPGDLQPALGAARVVAFARLAPDFARLAALPETEALRAALSLAPDGHDLASAIDLAATMAVATGAIARLKAGHAPLAPEAEASHAADLLRMIRGDRPSDTEARARGA